MPADAPGPPARATHSGIKGAKLEAMDRVSPTPADMQQPATSQLSRGGSADAGRSQLEQSGASRPNSREARDRTMLWIIGSAAIALALKLVLALNTIGTNDVGSFFRFAQALSQHGLEWTYANEPSFNHPPIVAYYLRFIYGLSRLPELAQNGISFALLLRLPGIIADFGVVVLLASWRKQLRLPTWALILFALSPVSLMVSGFHGNTDPVMVAFLVLAAAMCLRAQPLLCGIFLALSCQIKVIPLLMLPIFGCYWLAKRRPLPFGGAFAAVMALLWIQPLLNFPASLVKNVLAYGSYWGCWGITYWLRMTGLPQFSVVSYRNLPAAEEIVMGVLKVAIIVSVLLIAWRRKEVSGRGVFASLGYAWIIFFVLSPGIAPQYMVWLAPFVLVLSPTIAAGLMLSSSVFLFFFYQITAGGMPWYMATSTYATNEMTTPWSLWPWAALIAAMIILYRHAQQNQPDFRLLSLRSTASETAR